MKDGKVTLVEIEELLFFLPLFEEPNRKFVEWVGGKEVESEVFQMPYPKYSEDVMKFFRLAKQPCWRDKNYLSNGGSEMLQDENLIKNATIENIKTMFTFCVRGERFCDGLRAGMLENGKIIAILKRLEMLSKEFKLLTKKSIS